MKAENLPELGVIMRPGMPIRRRRTNIETNIDETASIISDEIAKDEIIQIVTSAIKIYVKGLEIAAQCGVYSHEMGKERKLIIDIEIEMQPSFKVAEDDLSNTYDYDNLANIAQNIAHREHFYLIETYAAEVAKSILDDLRVKKVTVKVEKPNSVKGAIASGTEITCSRR